ncbi:MAG: CDP-alcohol phosphatidyltransferase [Methylococcales symbiont of Iophon sp. n. MRB-2018]|nr:MAG: CDP-alcohol phosphatidyltransferase [Methylococcales symbiont of Iophon sp. n. MRB-2018]KAF3980293.1 MAG: CDP-alcohol phosphatidyltransferase [Methylococcales symbiont of Iophon sp. n. MRB-2018]
MTTEKSSPNKEQPETILSYVNDVPNLCSLAGLACTLLAIYYSILGVYAITMIGMIWAVAFDWADGLIARSMKARTKQQGVFGGQLDTLIDIVSYGVTPAILLLSYGKFDPVFLVGAFLMIAGAAIRLSYFSTFGLIGGKYYTGLALDNNSIILVFIVLFSGCFDEGFFSYILYASCLILTFLNVSQIKTPKLSGNPRNVYILAGYTLGMTAIYGWKLL